MDMEKRHKPSIDVVGTITYESTHTKISGWKLGLCILRCTCHRHPGTGQMFILQTANGSLGLNKYRFCHCCEPWTAKELEWVLALQASIDTMTTIEGAAS